MKSPKTLAKEVADFNAKHAVGAAVVYRSHPGAEGLETETTCAAFILSGHTAVVMVRKVSGAVALSAIEAKK